MTDYTKLVEALRCCGDVGCHKCPYQKHIHEHFCWTMAMHDAAAAIEALQAQLPKRGEWVMEEGAKITIHPLRNCSVCGAGWFGISGYNYCPSCGAKMEANNG